MDPSGGFASQLAEAARSMQGWATTQQTLDRVVSIATDLISGCDLVGISVVHRAGIDTPAASDDAVRTVDELQFQLREGPCYDALHTEDTVYSRDLATDGRWPKWGPRVVEETGALSIVSYRLFTSEDVLGAMNLYSRTVDSFDADDVYAGYALAAHVAVALAASENVEHLETAISHRTVIGRAEGILMERFDIPPAQAFAVLRRVSQSRNVRLSHVAEELVRTRETPS